MKGKSKDGLHQINAGQRYTIKGFTEAGDPILSNGWAIDKNWGGLMQGYVSTSQGVQGKTAWRGIAVYGSPSLVATRQEGFYVPVSRVRSEVAVLTDSNEELREAIQRQETKKSATELVTASRPAAWFWGNQRTRYHQLRERTAGAMRETTRERVLSHGR